jgi:glycine hydroxymethyltransferase
MFLKHLTTVDPDIAAILTEELHRQQNTLEMIASENFTSLAVMEAQGSVLTNKYAEGLPGKRYYGGCDVVDRAETLAIERAKQLFGDFAPDLHANVQPHSGASANLAAFLAVGMKPGDTFMGMSLDHGGHLTHGSPVNISGLYFNVVPYGIHPETGLLDFDQIASLARQHKPKLIVCGASAYSRVIDFEAFRRIADEVGAILMGDVAHIAGLIATGLHPNPFPHCHIVTTTTHKTLRGPRGGLIVCQEPLAKAVDKAMFPGLQGGPLMHVIAAKAVAFKEALSPEFKTYSQAVINNAQALADSLQAEGIGIVSGGTDNHLLTCDLTQHALAGKDLSGKEAQHMLEAVGITANKNTIPNDPRSPFVTSGIRLGTPALTTRGLTAASFTAIGQIIANTYKQSQPVAVLSQQSAELCRQFPLYPELLYPGLAELSSGQAAHSSTAEAVAHSR